MKANLIWLASYPKSGNTWVRIFFYNLLKGAKGNVDLANLSEIGFSTSSKKNMDLLLGIDSSHLNINELNFFLPQVLKLKSSEYLDKTFVKTHSSFIKNRVGEYIFPMESSFKAIYLIRNPLDVCVSYTHHCGSNYSSIVDDMADKDQYLGWVNNFNRFQIPQFLSSWSEHVLSWEKFPSSKLLVVRYEDLISDPLVYFHKMAKFLEYDFDLGQIESAINKSDFKKLQRLEQNKGFREKPSTSKKFFRKGKVGDWKTELKNKQVQKIISEHKEMMLKYNYIDLNLEPLN